MDNFSPAQYDRFEAYRRHALPKQAVRKVSLASRNCLCWELTVWLGHTTDSGTPSVSACRSDCSRFRQSIRWRNNRKRFVDCFGRIIVISDGMSSTGRSSAEGRDRTFIARPSSWSVSNVSVGNGASWRCSPLEVKETVCQMSRNRYITGAD